MAKLQAVWHCTWEEAELREELLGIHDKMVQGKPATGFADEQVQGIGAKPYY